MFRQIRYQTGEVKEILSEIEKGNIPCMDVDNWEDFYFFVNILFRNGLIRAEDFPLDKNARDRVKEPEFEFRAAFIQESLKGNQKPVYIDFYFEPDIEESYDPIMGD